MNDYNYHSLVCPRLLGLKLLCNITQVRLKGVYISKRRLKMFYFVFILCIDE